jgi:cystathionine beta-lyase
MEILRMQEHEAPSSRGALRRDVSALRGLHNEKWRRYGDDVLPAFIAEMDFAPADAVRQALEGRLARQDFGYPLPHGRHAGRVLAEAFAARMESKFAWHPDPAQVIVMGDLEQGLYGAVLAYTDPGDGVIVLTPGYPKISEAVNANQRRLLPLVLRDDGQRFVFDVDELERLAADRARMLILCNPHNPTGRVFSREELCAIGACAERHDLVVVADEIHADLVYPGRQHLPFASLHPDLAARTLTLNSASKSFNLPGLRCALGAFGSPALLQRFAARIPPRLLGDPNVFGLDATLAAWRDGQAWLDMVRAQLLRSRDHVVRRLQQAHSGIVLRAPEATYLAWLDCSALALPTSAAKYFLQHAKVALSPGKAFIDGGTAYVRLNFATSSDMLDLILDRMLNAL